MFQCTVQHGRLAWIEVLRAPVKQEYTRLRPRDDLSRAKRVRIYLQRHCNCFKLGRRDPRPASLDAFDHVRIDAEVPRGEVLTCTLGSDGRADFLQHLESLHPDLSGSHGLGQFDRSIGGGG